MKKVLLAVFSLTVLALPPLGAQEGAPAAASALSVERSAICTGVEKLEPVGAMETFPADVGALYCFTKITGAQEETTVTHVWYHGDTEMRRINLPVKSAAWRTWSQKNVPSSATGAWHVTVLDPSGNEIGKVSFTVGQ